MNTFTKYFPVAAATLAALAWIAPIAAHANPLVTPVRVSEFPATAADIAEICKLDDAFDIGELVVGPISNGDHSTTLMDDTFTVTISNGPGFVDISSANQRRGTPGVEAVVAGTGPGQPANVYCYFGATSDSGFVAPSGAAPTQLGFYWSRGPCLLGNEQSIENACAAYNGPPGDPDAQSAHYLQEHQVSPDQPINVCGCPYDAGAGVQQRIAQFCNSNFDEQGACPTGDQPLRGLATQATATSGDNTCQRVVIGGRAFFIGDTC